MSSSYSNSSSSSGFSTSSSSSKAPAVSAIGKIKKKIEGIVKYFSVGDAKHDFGKAKIEPVLKHLGSSYSDDSKLSLMQFQRAILELRTKITGSNIYEFLKGRKSNVGFLGSSASDLEYSQGTVVSEEKILDILLPQSYNSLKESCMDWFREGLSVNGKFLKYNNDPANRILYGGALKPMKGGVILETNNLVTGDGDSTSKSYNATFGITKANGVHYSIPQVLSGMTDGKRVFIILNDATMFAFSSLLTSIDLSDPNHYMVIFVASTENISDPATKLKDIDIDKKITPNVTIYFLKDLPGYKCTYTHWSGSENDNNSLLGNEFNSTSFVAPDGTVTTDITLPSGEQFSVYDYGTATEINNSANSIIKTVIEGGSSEAAYEKAFSFLAGKKHGDWKQALCLLDKGRSYKVFNVKQQPDSIQFPDNTMHDIVTIQELLDAFETIGAALMLSTLDRILAAYAVMLGIDVLISFKFPSAKKVSASSAAASAVESAGDDDDPSTSVIAGLLLHNTENDDKGAIFKSLKSLITTLVAFFTDADPILRTTTINVFTESAKAKALEILLDPSLQSNLDFKLYVPLQIFHQLVRLGEPSPDMLPELSLQAHWESLGADTLLVQMESFEADALRQGISIDQVAAYIMSHDPPSSAVLQVNEKVLKLEAKMHLTKKIYEFATQLAGELTLPIPILKDDYENISNLRELIVSARQITYEENIEDEASKKKNKVAQPPLRKFKNTLKKLVEDYQTYQTMNPTFFSPELVKSFILNDALISTTMGLKRSSAAILKTTLKPQYEEALKYIIQGQSGGGQGFDDSIYAPLAHSDMIRITKNFEEYNVEKFKLLLKESYNLALIDGFEPTLVWILDGLVHLCIELYNGIAKLEEGDPTKIKSPYIDDFIISIFDDIISIYIPPINPYPTLSQEEFIERAKTDPIASEFLKEYAEWQQRPIDADTISQIFEAKRDEFLPNFVNGDRFDIGMQLNGITIVDNAMPSKEIFEKWLINVYEESNIFGNYDAAVAATSEYKSPLSEEQMTRYILIKFYIYYLDITEGKIQKIEEYYETDTAKGYITEDQKKIFRRYEEAIRGIVELANLLGQADAGSATFIERFLPWIINTTTNKLADIPYIEIDYGHPLPSGEHWETSMTKAELLTTLSTLKIFLIFRFYTLVRGAPLDIGRANSVFYYLDQVINPAIIPYYVTAQDYASFLNPSSAAPTGYANSSSSSTSNSSSSSFSGYSGGGRRKSSSRSSKRTTRKQRKRITRRKFRRANGRHTRSKKN